jgi:hypothetical protein
MFPQQEPEPSDGQAVGKWDYLKVENGRSAVGYLAGYPSRTYVHHVGNSVPCKRKITKSVLVCPYCEAGKVPEWRGYVPLYSAQYVRLFTIITKDYLESVEQIPIHSQIRCSRGKNRHDPVVITEEKWSPRPLPLTPERDQEIDLRPFLLRLWKDQELVEWCRSLPLTLPLTEEKPRRKPATRSTTKPKHPPLPPTPEPVPSDQTLDETFASIKRKWQLPPVVNGKHEPRD